LSELRNAAAKQFGIDPAEAQVFMCNRGRHG
jgi:hypothetical protein